MNEHDDHDANSGADARVTHARAVRDAAASDHGETFATDHATGQPVLRRIVLEVTDGPDRGTTLALPPRTVLVGSGSGADLRLTDKEVSRRHLEIAIVDDGVRVVDVGSKNGTYIVGVGRVGATGGRGDGDGDGVKVEHAILAPGNAVRVGNTTLALRALDEPVDVGERASLGGLVGRSNAMRTLFALLARAAKSRATVLIEGETGTGKEEIARALHEESAWKKQPFIVFDCGATTPQLIASELFGHKKGAFTGATDDRAGLFEEAKGGTLFLDEIGELPLDLQPSLLRVLESRQVRRVGENRVRDVDVRVIAATNRDLEKEIAAGRFRRDLFFRLALIQVRVPPLRERPDDLDVLAEKFLAAAGEKRRLSSSELAALKKHAWPGNVRELRNVVDRAVALGTALSPGASSHDGIGAHDVATTPTSKRGDRSPPLTDRPYREARGEAIATFERRYVVELLKKHAGNVSQAAREAGVDRNWLHRLMKRYAILRNEIE